MSTKPFYFIAVFWGERFREYFVNCCLLSLLSPNNIPALSPERKSRFLIATRPDDWAAIEKSVAFRRLKQFVEPVFIEIPECPPGVSGCVHMGLGHSAACAEAFREGALGVILTPDCMLSDGTVRRMQEEADNGTELVLVAALRFGEEPFFENLHKTGALKLDVDGFAQDEYVQLTGRQLARAAANGLHSETLSYEWDCGLSNPVCPAAWWRVPRREGMLVHSMSWAPLLIDYQAVREHDTSAIENWTIDGDYIWKNFGTGAKMHVVTDSDDMFIASWAKMSEYNSPRPPVAPTWAPWLRNACKSAEFNSSYFSLAFDPLKRRLCYLPVRWHAGELDQEWDRTEAIAQRQLQDSIERRHLRIKLISRFFEIFMSIYQVTRRARTGRPFYRLWQAMKGDCDARRWVVWRVKCVLGFRPEGPPPVIPPY